MTGDYDPLWVRYVREALERGTATVPDGPAIYAEPIIGPGRVFDELPPETCPCPSCVQWRAERAAPRVEEGQEVQHMGDPLKVTVTISGPVKTGKSAIAAVIADALDDAGIAHTVNDVNGDKPLVVNQRLRRLVGRVSVDINVVQEEHTVACPEDVTLPNEKKP